MSFNPLYMQVQLDLQIDLRVLSYQFTRRVIKLTVVIIGGYHYNQLRTKFYRIFFSQGCPYVDEIIGDHQCGF
jgi:hypothetical protein